MLNLVVYFINNYHQQGKIIESLVHSSKRRDRKHPISPCCPSRLKKSTYKGGIKIDPPRFLSRHASHIKCPLVNSKLKYRITSFHAYFLLINYWPQKSNQVKSPLKRESIVECISREKIINKFKSVTFC